MEKNGREIAVGMGHYIKDPHIHTAEVAFTVRDDHHNEGIGTQLLTYLTRLAKDEGLQGFTAEVLLDNRPMLKVFEKMGFDMNRTIEDNIYKLVMRF